MDNKRLKILDFRIWILELFFQNLELTLRNLKFFVFYFLLFIVFCPLSASAQKFYSKQEYINKAQAAEKSGNWSDAADNFENAWHLQPKNFELLSKAAMLYQKSRDYIKAAQSYKILITQPKFASTRLEYARALHQTGQYDEAIPEYLLYLNNYEKKDRETVAEKIETDIAGCAKAIRETDSTSKQKDFERWNTDTRIFSTGTTTNLNIQSPILFSDDILYYVARTRKDTSLMRAQWLNADWSQGQLVPNMATITEGAIESGTFSSNGNVFYFSRIQRGKQKTKEKNTIRTSQLYFVERVNDTWSSPKLLNENINAPASTNTQPFSIEKDGYEYLFFSSNRKNGAGGMDIWFSRRRLNLPQTSFETAQNCGKIINTDGDEITPFYDTELGTLYFSSNGRPVFGGFDVFKSKGWMKQWLTPENIGLPFNSSADDSYFKLNKSHTLGLLVSNRTLGLEKINTQEDDLFSFILKNNTQDFYVFGRVFNKTNGDLLKNERVTLYEKKDNEDLRVLTSIVSTEGLFRFRVFPNKSYSLEVDKDSFNLKNIEFSTTVLKEDLSQPVFLDKTYFYTDSRKIKKENIPQVVSKTDTISKSAVIEIKKPKDKPVKTKEINPTKSNSSVTVVYKVQVLAYEEMDWSVKKRLIRIEDIGNFDTEKTIINGKNFTRVLFKATDSYSEAQSVLREVKNRSLNDAFIVKYENGKRVGK